jgi:SPP1 family predicted phage head-tail adaptor
MLPQLVKIVDGMPQIDVGALRHPIRIEQLGPTSPPTIDAGGPVMVWSTYAQCVAAMGVMRGTDVIRSGQTTSESFAEFAVWYQPGIAAKMRIVMERTGKIYLIQSVEDVLEMNVALVLNCVGLALS